ncbi:MAG: NYN domain-containing protein [Eubacteriales bacterium]|nr:NYN domain-containing protein [Eubacteriales bacterium]
MFNFFRKNDRLSAAVIFVDFEHWTISLSNLFGLRPNVQGFYDTVSKRFSVKKIMVFGDFSNDILNTEKDRWNDIPCEIIDTQNESLYKKDLTDFVMLDAIYRQVQSDKQCKNYILFTGDGHFSYASKYLREQKKNVIIYGIRNAFSGRLKDEADESIELPSEIDEKERYFRLIIDNFNYIYNNDNSRILPTFRSTAAVISARNNIPEERIREALQELLDRGILYKSLTRVDYANTIKILKVEWKKAINAGLWSADRA